MSRSSFCSFAALVLLLAAYNASAQSDATRFTSVRPLFSAAAPQPKDAIAKDNDRPLPKALVRNPILWEQRDDIGSLDLLYGQGGQKHLPAPPFTFLQESMHGTNPKFDARDANDHKWRVKLGEEARPEVASSRLLWAVGYFVEDDYVLAKATVSGLNMKRGKNVIDGEQITDARFARKAKGEKKIGTWAWKQNPFFGTKEFNGLRVMMAVLNNWDLKDDNNSVFSDSENDRQIFLVSDIGATFATNNITNSRKKDKGNVEKFKESKFIAKLTDTEVSFGTPAAPTGLLLMSGGTIAPDYMRRRGFDWIGKDIPRADARWIGSLLGQLTHQQIMDAFRAGNFPPEQVDLYATVVEDRIQELKQL